MGSESKVFTYSEVSAHNTSEDCWVIINGKVYNVTSYLNDHPGGDEVILGQAGKDASEEFEDVGHGSAARLMLDEYYVGEVDPSIKPPTYTLNATLAPIEITKDKSSNSTNKLLYIILVLAIIGLSMGIHIFNFSS
ncbi:Cytochrome b5 [Handroanthus impetiginosus]|uniref:Cytochrome b5 n=1 Tax=Handroanthus impetiginosus TaxID=429701 RepID=A0A2G9H1U0_9LAMI|nr:Cytochrome b5 [Handroanthus impetiginosus]